MAYCLIGSGMLVGIVTRKFTGSRFEVAYERCGTIVKVIATCPAGVNTSGIDVGSPIFLSNSGGGGYMVVHSMMNKYQQAYQLLSELLKRLYDSRSSVTGNMS